jgi:hypothetical protein
MILEGFKFLIFLRIKMKILKEKELEAKLNERYNDHPEGWKCFRARDKKGHYAVGWVNRRIGEQYWLKFASQYSPTCVGFISTFNEDFPFLKDSAFDKDYGIRIVDVTCDEEKKMAEKGSMISSVLKKIIIVMDKKPPEPDDEEKHRTCGAIPNLLVTCLEDISPSQKELEIKMQEEIERLDRQRISGYTF